MIRVAPKTGYAASLYKSTRPVDPRRLSGRTSRPYASGREAWLGWPETDARCRVQIRGPRAGRFHRRPRCHVRPADPRHSPKALVARPHSSSHFHRLWCAIQIKSVDKYLACLLPRNSVWEAYGKHGHLKYDNCWSQDCSNGRAHLVDSGRRYPPVLR